MEFSSVKGFRDFYPEDMILRNTIADAWRRVSLRNGFVEYEGPMLEYLDLYRVKSGDEIVSQLFRLTDRGGRELAIRPEQTPTLARMVNARINALPRPIKWFSIPWLCRAENPQRGRGREFFQWNVDVIGSDAALADAECIFALADLLAELGLAPSEARIFLSSRSLITAALSAVGVAPARHEAMLPILDKRDKVAGEAFEAMCVKEGLTAEQIGAISAFQDAATLDEAASRLGDSNTVAAECATLSEVMAILERMGAGDYCRLDLHVVRGLAYYTGVVYEAFDPDRTMRALAGGGRYDNLLEMLGGPRIGATGFGMGDMVLANLLADRGKLPDVAASCDCYVVDAGAGLFDATLGAVADLRRAGLRTNLSYKRQSLGKQLKAASRSGAAVAVIVGAELAESGELTVKDLATGEQRRVRRADLVAELKR